MEKGVARTQELVLAPPCETPTLLSLFLSLSLSLKTSAHFSYNNTLPSCKKAKKGAQFLVF
jgi:hypothetical protein